MKKVLAILCKVVSLISIIRYHYTPIIKAKNLKTENIHVGKNVEQPEIARRIKIDRRIK